MNKLTLLLFCAFFSTTGFSQIQFNATIEPAFGAETVLMPPSPLKSQVIFILRRYEKIIEHTLNVSGKCDFLFSEP